jgi:hypothetical protein
MLDELNHEATGLEEIDPEQLDLEQPLHLDSGDVVGLRRLMIRIQQLDADRERVKATKAAVVASYDDQLGRIAKTSQWLRSSLQAYVERFGKVQLPDVGTAYLQDGDPKVEVVDREAFKVEFGEMFTKPVFDETAAKRYALEQAKAGQPIAPGVDIVPGGPQLRIRKA